MARKQPDERGGDQQSRFGRSGHTSHQERSAAPPPPAGGPAPGPAPAPAEQQQFDTPTYYAPREPRAFHETERLPPPAEAATHYMPVSPGDPQLIGGPGRQHASVSDGRRHTQPDVYQDTVMPTGHPPQTGVPKVTVSRAVASRSQQAARYVTNKVIAASKADGASESGLTRLIWNQVLSFGADAMITVALAGTVFFSAAKSDQRGNVLAYLLITMAPFAVVAPVIGPVLDRLQHGRRLAMAVSAFGRALLAILMAQNFTNLYALFPLALGSLVLSKAYSVVRAAAAPRLVPQNMSLVTANARLSLFGLGAMLACGGVMGAVIKVTGSYWLGLWLTAVPFAATGVFALKLPKQVDAASSAPRPPKELRSAGQPKVSMTARLKNWAGRGYGRPAITALQGVSMLRWTTGFLTLFMAFWIQNASHGFEAAGQLGAIGAGVGAGNAVGTAVGARLKLGHPDRLVIFCAAIASAACIVTALVFGITAAVILMFVASAVNSLGKVSLDAVIQRDVGETYRGSAFARSETFLQLAWVFGAAVAILLPLGHAQMGMGVAAAVTGLSVIAILLRSRASTSDAMTSREASPGTV